MNNTLINIQNLIGETTEYDKKEMLESKKPKSWLKSVSAFANGIGGTLMFGISDDDRIEIYSPGGMFDGTRVQDIDLMNVPSRRRNPVIADIFNRLKYMDRRGSGFKNILEDYKFYKAQENGLMPQFRSERSSFFITLWNLNYHVVKDGTKKQSDPEVIQSDPEVIQSNIDRLIELIKSNPSISRAQLAQLLQLSERQTRKIMDQLRKKGKLVRKGSDYNGKWIII